MLSTQPYNEILLPAPAAYLARLRERLGLHYAKGRLVFLGYAKGAFSAFGRSLHWGNNYFTINVGLISVFQLFSNWP